METATRLKQDIITETVREWILKGKYAPGEKLPTDSELANQFLVNRCTVAAGLNRLVEEKLLDRAPKRGTVVMRQDRTFQTNAVALVTIDHGEVYSNLAADINLHLQENGLYPVLLNNSLILDKNQIYDFLNNMVKQSYPYGYLLLGDAYIPYERLKQAPICHSNIVFMLRYHNYEELPHAKYVLLDYEDMGRQIVEYFAERNIKRILFPAVPEKHYSGPWSSMQYSVMQSIKKYSSAVGVEFDEGLFWRLHSDAPVDIVLPIAVEKSKVPTGIFCWNDFYLCERIIPVLQTIDGGLDQFVLLGNFNTKRAAEYGFDSFDHRADEVARIAVDMLTCKIDERKIFLPAKLTGHNKSK